MTAPRRPAPAYELTVAGRLGPVVRAMLAPVTTTSCEFQTILCLRGRDDEDLVDMLRVLGSHGLDIATIHTIR